jgi:uncharacterized protein (TIGR01440 family)
MRDDLLTALDELYGSSRAEEGGMLVVGCSTSEIIGEKIGTAGSEEIARVVAAALLGFCAEKRIDLAAQCCEHLNRALVVEKSVMKKRGLTRVNAVPHRRAGGAFATAVYAAMTDPVLVDRVVADFGIDIGGTLIGMHVRPVVVPFRSGVKTIGEARIILARSRPPYVGGERAVYDPDLA